jgi:tRNA-binding protein
MPGILNFKPKTELLMSITWSDFEKIDIRTGTVIEVKDFPKARKPAYQLVIDFGAELGIKKSSAQITTHYTKEDLLNRQVIAVVNFPPKQIADFISECLVLGVYDENKDVILLKPDKLAENGSKIG